MPVLKYWNGSAWVAIDGGGGGGGSVAAAWPFGGLEPLDQSGWSWINQGSAVVAQTDELVSLMGPSSGGGSNLKMRVTTAPATPYTIELGVVPFFLPASAISQLNLIGFVFRESGTGKVISVVHANFRASTANAPPAIWAGAYNSPTSWNSLQGTETPFWSPFFPPFGVVWLRVQDTGTNLVAEWSLDRITWTAIFTLGRAAFLAGGPDQVGIVQAHESGLGSQQGGWVIHWEQT